MVQRMLGSHFSLERMVIRNPLDFLADGVQGSYGSLKLSNE